MEYEKSNLMNALRVAGAVTLASLTGCAGARNYSTLSEASKVLGVPEWAVEYLPNGYKTDKGIALRLKAISGVYDGTAEYIISYSENGSMLVIDGNTGSDETVKKLAEMADRDPKDFIINSNEINILEKAVIGSLKNLEEKDIGF